MVKEYLRRFYQETAAGEEASREWREGDWSEGDWDAKFEVCTHKQQPQSKGSESHPQAAAANKQPPPCCRAGCCS